MQKLFFGDPNRKGKFHIFGEDKRSLCNKWGMPFFTPDEEDYLKGTETCAGDDCKSCFNKLEKYKEEMKDGD